MKSFTEKWPCKLLKNYGRIVCETVRHFFPNTKHICFAHKVWWIRSSPPPRIILILVNVRDENPIIFLCFILINWLFLSALNGIKNNDNEYTFSHVYTFSFTHCIALFRSFLLLIGWLASSSKMYQNQALLSGTNQGTLNRGSVGLWMSTRFCCFKSAVGIMKKICCFKINWT
jgi:hypothetical protein